MRSITLKLFDKSGLTKLTIALFVSLAILIANVGAAGAISSPSYLYNNQPQNNLVPMLYAANPYYSSIKAYYPDGSKFWMHCYLINPNANYYGNYWSTMYFYGVGRDDNWGWIHSSYVYWQISVPRC